MPQLPQTRMELASTLRLLWRARRLVAVGAALGLLAGTMLLYKVSLGPGPGPVLAARGHSVGVASAQVLVDSKSSQAVDLGEEPVLIDIPGLIARARLLANLIATSPLRDQVARRAGVDPRTFLATAPSIGFDSPKPEPGASAAGRLNVMNVTFNEALPIVTINAEADDEATAARISSAAATELGTYLDSLVAHEQIGDAHQLVVKALGTAEHATVHRGPRRLSAIAAFGFIFALWCTAIIVISRFSRGWRAASPLGASTPGVAAGPAGGRVDLPPAGAGHTARVPLSEPAPLHVLPERPERPEQPRRGVSA